MHACQAVHLGTCANCMCSRDTIYCTALTTRLFTSHVCVTVTPCSMSSTAPFPLQPLSAAEYQLLQWGTNLQAVQRPLTDVTRAIAKAAHAKAAHAKAVGGPTGDWAAWIAKQMDDMKLAEKLADDDVTLDAELHIKWSEIVAGLQEGTRGIHEHPFPHMFNNLVPFLDNARQHVGHKRQPGSLNLALCIEKVLQLLPIDSVPVS